MNSGIKIKDKVFDLFLDKSDIQSKVVELAEELSNSKYHNPPIMICVLGGAIHFFSDLIRCMNISVEVAYTKLVSYDKTESKDLKESFGIDVDIKDREVIIVEDVVDTGKTINYLIQELTKQKPRSIEVCTLFYKPDKDQFGSVPDYVGYNICSSFIVGYGMDYDGLGRNLDQVYILNPNKKVTEFNVLECNMKGEIDSYDVLPYFRRCWESKEFDRKKVKTREGLKQWISRASHYQFWSRCEYEMLISNWPPRKDVPAVKVDIHTQLMMNLETITDILYEEFFK